MLQLIQFRWGFLHEAIEVLSIKNVSNVNEVVAPQVVIEPLTIHSKFFHFGVAQFLFVVKRLSDLSRDVSEIEKNILRNLGLYVFMALLKL